MIPPLSTPGNAWWSGPGRPVGDDLVADDPALDPQATGVGRAAAEADVVGAVTVLEGQVVHRAESSGQRPSGPRQAPG